MSRVTSVPETGHGQDGGPPAGRLWARQLVITLIGPTGQLVCRETTVCRQPGRLGGCTLMDYVGNWRPESASANLVPRCRGAYARACVGHGGGGGTTALRLLNGIVQ